MADLGDTLPARDCRNGCGQQIQMAYTEHGWRPRDLDGSPHECSIRGAAPASGSPSPRGPASGPTVQQVMNRMQALEKRVAAIEDQMGLGHGPERPAPASRAADAGTGPPADDEGPQ